MRPRSCAGGELGGLIEARDSILGGAIRELDAFAYSVAESFNAVHRGRARAGRRGPRTISSPISRVSPASTTPRATSGSRPTSTRARGGTIRHIAAGAAANPVTGGPEAAPGDTGWVEELKNLRGASVPTYLAGDVPGTPTGSPTSMVSSLGRWIGDIGQGGAERRALARPAGFGARRGAQSAGRGVGGLDRRRGGRAREAPGQLPGQCQGPLDHLDDARRPLRGALGRREGRDACGSRNRCSLA
jgi:hypothetical protein